MIRTMRRGAKKVEKRKQRENPRTFAVLGFMVIKGRTYLREHEQKPLKILHFYGMGARVSQ